MARCRNTLTVPHSSPGNLVFCCQRSPRNSTESAPISSYLLKMKDFSMLAPYTYTIKVVEMVQDRHVAQVSPRWGRQIQVVKKVARTWLPSVGFRPRFLAVSLQATWVINPAVGCDYFTPGPQLPSQPLRRLLPVSLLGEQRHYGCEQFAQDLPDSVTTSSWTQALLCVSPAC